MNFHHTHIRLSQPPETLKRDRETRAVRNGRENRPRRAKSCQWTTTITIIAQRQQHQLRENFGSSWAKIKATEKKFSNGKISTELMIYWFPCVGSDTATAIAIAIATVIVVFSLEDAFILLCRTFLVSFSHLSSSFLLLLFLFKQVFEDAKRARIHFPPIDSIDAAVDFFISLCDLCLVCVCTFPNMHFNKLSHLKSSNNCKRKWASTGMENALIQAIASHRWRWNYFHGCKYDDSLNLNIIRHE